ncbi:unnamed protein product [Allacma fusca]|uniref:Myosin motor domain-containing protein n=2 Tax=Allacma fusca TaxID=39272 RepID=A0A8J2P0A4_9HEXA|nr:unnamed protein product [Allacma fusca]
MADQAYHAMLHQKRLQNIVISGESGSGKTESAKLLLQQLVYLGRAPNRNLEAKILQVNPIMEAFGNAETGMNENSSRFGKYLDVTFTRAGKVTGAKIDVYLLEESRVHHQARGERNFHIFYYLLDGSANTDLQKELNLNKHGYNYLRGALTDNADLKAVHKEMFQAVKNGFCLLGFRLEEINAIYRILSAILHLGEIEFDEVKDEDSCHVHDPESLEMVADLLGITAGDLGLALTTRSVVASGESFVRRHTAEEAYTTRDSLARGLYNRLFRWVVNQVNALLGVSRQAYGDPLSIGLLDIFGFETYKTNSLEQLRINITNEQLQFFFNQHVFTWEQQEYMAEGIEIDIIRFSDNRPILELCLGKPLGILSLLDEESRFPRATDWTFLEKLNSNFANNKLYVRSRSSADTTFSVRHYAGRVQYDVKGFLDKNRSYFSPDLVEILRGSSIDTIRYLYRCMVTKTGHLHVPSLVDGNKKARQI